MIINTRKGKMSRRQFIKEQNKKAARKARKRAKQGNRAELKSSLQSHKLDVSELFGMRGIYFLHKKDKGVVYVGMSECIITRVSQHYKQRIKDFDSITYEIYEDVTKDELAAVERRYIETLEPIYNEVHNPNR
jgi:hypothetical protein